ncbi:MAG: leucine-rich repeat domain-containing protein, partial [Pseudomonadota bacterium]
LRNTPVSDLTELAGLSGLRSLDLRNTPVSDLTALAGLRGLQRLYLNDTQVSDLTALAGLSGLQELYLDGTQVSDLTALAGLSGLQALYLDRTKVRDLTPIVGLENLRSIKFSGTPVLDADPALKDFAKIYSDREKVADLQAYLRDRKPPEPAEPLDTGPEFEAQDDSPILLAQPAMDQGDDPDQAEMQKECRRKVTVLTEHSQKIDNQFPTLVNSAERYSQLIHQSAAEIGARTIWSAANTLRQALEAHLAAVKQGRQMDELPPEVAAALKDLVETHGVWFLGHPGAVEVEERVRAYTRGPDSARIRDEAIAVVTAAEEAPSVVDPAAVEPARDDIIASEGEGPAAEKAEKSLRDWTWNLIAVAARRLYKATKWGGGTVASHDLIQWFVGNETILGNFAKQVMTNGPLWFDGLVNALRQML